MKLNLIVMFLFVHLLLLIESKRVIFYAPSAIKSKNASNEYDSDGNMGTAQIIQAPDPKLEDCKKNQVRDKHNRCRRRV